MDATRPFLGRNLEKNERGQSPVYFSLVSRAACVKAREFTMICIEPGLHPDARIELATLSKNHTTRPITRLTRLDHKEK
jgi:hypothetical protein